MKSLINKTKNLFMEIFKIENIKNFFLNFIIGVLNFIKKIPGFFLKYLKNKIEKYKKKWKNLKEKTIGFCICCKSAECIKENLIRIRKEFIALFGWPDKDDTLTPKQKVKIKNRIDVLAKFLNLLIVLYLYHNYLYYFQVTDYSTQEAIEYSLKLAYMQGAALFVCGIPYLFIRFFIIPKLFVSLVKHKVCTAKEGRRYVYAIGATFVIGYSIIAYMDPHSSFMALITKIELD